MKKYIRLILILFITANSQLSAQTFPVVSTTQIIPPYSVYLSDYASASSDKLIANLMLQDQNQSGLQVKLKITITGDNGVKLETKPEFMPPPITMYSGSPEQISGIALQQYLEPANMNITGLNFSQFMQNKKLPEGIYTFTIEAVEYRRNKLVSNPGTAVGWLILNDPPIWNLPQNNSTITATNPQNVFFSWLPMHTGSPNSAFSTEFEFSLYDIIPQDRNPEEAVNTGIPIYQSTTMSNSLVYGPAETPLELGRKYAVRLKAYDTEGRDMFKNNGYSTVLVFTYGQECITPVGISHDNITPHTADINWTSIPGNTEFTLYYREKEEGGTNTWYEGNTAQSSAVISQLKPLHTYQYVVKALCGTIESEPSAIYEFTTTEKITDTLNCGDNPNIPVIDGSPPLEELLFGDVINVGGFEGIITQARGGNGVFSGKCIMKVSNFNILLKSHFDDISINQSYQVTAGHVIADRGPGIMINLDEVISFVDSLAGIPPDSIIADIDDFIDDADSVIYEIEPALLNDSLTEDLETILGNLNEVSGDTTLTETQQNEIDNLIEQIESLLNQNSEGSDNPSFVMFKKFPEQKYGFDEPDSILSLREYYRPPNIINGKEQLIRWKSIKANGGIDQIYARLDSINPNLKFYNGAGTEITPQDSPVDTIKVINITGGQATLNGETTDKIIAKIELNDTTSIDAGILNIVSYEEQTKKLVIVPVNGNTLPAGMSLAQFTDSLNKTYGQAVVHWQTEMYPTSINFDYALADSIDSFNAWPAENTITTPDMSALVTTFVAKGDYDPEKSYLFLLDNSKQYQLIGLMPYFQPFGYIFTDDLSILEFDKTAQHEIGHGVFGLEHPFRRHEGIDRFATENLMTNHPSSTFLNKYQWDLIQHPVCFLDGDCGTGVTAGMERDMSFEPVVTLDVMKVLSQTDNIPADYLTNVEKLNPGAFIPVNNDDDDCDYNEDKNNMTSYVAGETDLLTITIRGISKAIGYFHFETNNNNIKIWTSPNRVTQQNTTAVNANNLTANDVFAATTSDLTYYVEGINSGACNLTLVWTRSSKGNSTRYIDNVNFTIFNKEGPRYVPENSRYEYRVTGPVAGSWIANNKCTIVSQTGNNVEVDWGEGPDVGQLIYKVNNNYFWNFETDIVKVEITQYTNGGITYPYFRRGNNVTDNFAHFNVYHACDRPCTQYIRTAWYRAGLPMVGVGVAEDFAAIVFRANIELSGPTRNTVNDRGIKKMQVGWIQNASNPKNMITTTYAYDPPVPDDISGHSDDWYVDYNETATPPATTAYYHYLDYEGFVDGNGTSIALADIANPNPIIGSDNPDLAIRLKKMGTTGDAPAVVQLANGICNGEFKIFICANTTDQMPGTSIVYTPYKYAEWNYHLTDCGINVYGDQFSTPVIVRYIQGNPVNTSLITLPVGGNLQNWQRGVSPNPITINPPANLSPDQAIIQTYYNAF